jgi:RNase P subunit RPR2
MATRNSITNDLIQTKALSKEGRDRWDDIFRKRFLCRHCKEGYVVYVPEVVEAKGNYGGNSAHWACPKCDSTYPETEYIK